VLVKARAGGEPAVTILAIIIGASLAFLWWIAEHAPEGWESEEHGFRYGRPKDDE
jgi:hypothetical protein